MSEYVKKSEAKQSLYDYFYPNSPIVISLIDKAIDATPTTDVIEVRHGKWTKDKSKSSDDGGIYDYCCSLCNREAEKDEYGNCTIFTNYCPDCGAKMDIEGWENCDCENCEMLCCDNCELYEGAKMGWE